MCGRFDRHRALADFTEAIEGLRLPGDDLLPGSYNIAPSQQAAAVCASEEGPKLCSLQWGLVPGWARKEGLSRPINARAETVAEKPMFRESFKTGRCLVLADGYYEWRSAAGSAKQPFYITLENGAPFVMAGIWAKNTALAPNPIESFCLITTDANASCKEVHHRMPLILHRDHHAKWLAGSKLTEDEAQSMLQPYPGGLRLTPVSRFVNSPANNSAECIRPMNNELL